MIFPAKIFDKRGDSMSEQKKPAQKKSPFPSYTGKTLVRFGDTIY